MGDPKFYAATSIKMVLNIYSRCMIVIRKLYSLSLYLHGSQFSMVFIMSAILNVYLVMGLSKVMPMYHLFWDKFLIIGKFWGYLWLHASFAPNARYPKIIPMAAWSVGATKKCDGRTPFTRSKEGPLTKTSRTFIERAFNYFFMKPWLSKKQNIY